MIARGAAVSAIVCGTNCAGDNESSRDRVFFVLVVRSADLQEQRSGTRRTSVAEEHLNVALRVRRIETAAPPIGGTERGARYVRYCARSCVDSSSAFDRSTLGGCGRQNLQT